MRWHLAVLVLAVAACTSAPRQVAEPTVVPPPTPGTDVVLTVGAADRSVDWDLPGLATLPTRDVTVQEPFLQRPATFTVVRFTDVLASSGVPATATVHLTALDDYTVDLDLGDPRTTAALLALAEDGHAIAVADGGPIRIVFPDGSDLGRNEDTWIWSLRSTEVTG
jgi:hypothetical protein